MPETSGCGGSPWRGASRREGEPPSSEACGTPLLERAAARALPRQGGEQAPPERDPPSARHRARAVAMLATMLASAASLGAAIGLTAAALQASSAVGRRGGQLVATVVAAWGPGLATAMATGGVQLRPRGRGEGGFAATRVGEAAHPGPRDGNEPPPLRLPSADTPDSALRRGRGSREPGSSGHSRSAFCRHRPRPRSSPAAAEEEAASDEELRQRVRSLDVGPSTPPARWPTAPAPRHGGGSGGRRATPSPGGGGGTKTPSAASWQPWRGRA